MQKINNDIYQELGERWYHADDDPVALLRAESRVRNPWVVNILKRFYGDSIESRAEIKVLDVGCGGGFLSNYLAQEGFQVHGIDISDASLAVARKFDQTGSVNYEMANAIRLPFKDNCFDAICAMDFLEHVEHPDKIIREISRVLRPSGLFFFHTFNRNLMSWLVIIKAVEFFVRNTPKHMHILRLFIKPRELQKYCEQSQLEVKEFIGYRPNLMTWTTIKNFLKGVVPTNFSFTQTKSLLTSYSGYAIKIVRPEL